MDNLLDFRPLVSAFARRFQGQGLEREDLEQEAWLALVEAERDWDPSRNVPKAAFFRRQVWTALKRLLRRHRRDPLGGEWLELRERSARVEELPQDASLLEMLTTRQRQVLYLYFWHELSLAEIARRLDLAVSTVHTHKQRGLRALATGVVKTEG